MLSEFIKNRIIQKLSESSKLEIGFVPDDEDLDEVDKEMYDRAHPNRQSKKEKENIVLFVREAVRKVLSKQSEQ